MGRVLSSEAHPCCDRMSHFSTTRPGPSARGSHAIAGLWNGEHVIGCLSADNLLEHQPLTEQQCELLALYASALGHLCSRKRVEEGPQPKRERLPDPDGQASDAIFIMDSRANLINRELKGLRASGVRLEDLLE